MNMCTHNTYIYIYIYTHTCTYNNNEYGKNSNIISDTSSSFSDMREGAAANMAICAIVIVTVYYYCNLLVLLFNMANIAVWRIWQYVYYYCDLLFEY